MKQFMDIFSIPEMTLLAVANDFFITNDIEYDPVHLFKDVSVCKHVNLTVLNVALCFQAVALPCCPAEKQTGLLYFSVFICCGSSVGRSGIC